MTAALPVAEYLDYRDRVGESQLLWENNGWSVRGTAGDLEILAWVSPYLLKGFDGGPFALRTAAVNQSLLIAVDPETAPGTLHDNDFVAVGWDVDEMLPWRAWSVTTVDGGVTWSAPGRSIVSKPPFWRVTGDHGGVGLDLDIEAVAAPMWLTNPATGLDAREDRWFIANATATGTLATDGGTVPLHGHAVHERHVHLGTSYDPVTLLRDGGVTWHTGHSDEVYYAVLARPSRGQHWGQVCVRDTAWTVDDVAADVTQRWYDPRTGLVVPSAWTLRLDGAGGTLDLHTTARARAFYRWDHLNAGSTQLYWWLCETTGSLRGRDGSVEQMGRLRSEAHLNRTLEPREVRR